MKLKAALWAALSAAAVLFSSCGNVPADSKSAGIQTADPSALGFYDRFSQAEVENMIISKLGLFSLTCDYDTREIKFYTSGEELNVVYKLTNMTDMTVNTELQIMGGECAEDIASLYVSEKNSPAATGWCEEKTFQPYETYEIPVKLTVPQEAAGKGCYLASRIDIQMLDPEIYERMQINYCRMPLNDMYVPVQA